VAQRAGVVFHHSIIPKYSGRFATAAVNAAIASLLLHSKSIITFSSRFWYNTIVSDRKPRFLDDSYFGWQDAFNPAFMPWGMDKGFKVTCRSKRRRRFIGQRCKL